jgi:isoleucyl-tRNA synthetase
MPFAQFGAPYRNGAGAQASYPADFICEAIDQTRGWFYSLMAVGTLVFDQSSYRTVVCLGHILAEDGKKMSKHLGNILEPISLMERHGADALRWFMLCNGSPWASRRIGHKVLDEIASKVLRTYWSIASFQSLYARANGWDGTQSGEPTQLDRWALSEVNRLAAEVDAALEDFDTQRAGRALSAYIDDLSNWYVRRSRRRFWEGPGSASGRAAFATLHECVTQVTLLMAPVTPFVTDYVWGVLCAAGAADSVHLARWPSADSAVIDPGLSAQMGLVRRLVELGRSARSGAAVRTRQPLGRALIGAAGFAELPFELRELVADELNVRTLEPLSGELVDYTVKPNFRSLGRRFGPRTPSVAAAVTAAPAPEVAAAVLSGGTYLVLSEVIGAEDVIVTQTPRAGWAVASELGETVALDITITPELRREGLAREVIRLIQESRKNDGLDVTDRIALHWSASEPEMAEALTVHARLIADEVLAAEFSPGDASSLGWAEHAEPELGLTFWLRRMLSGWWRAARSWLDRGGRHGRGCSRCLWPRPGSSSLGRPRP